eukprot:m.238777 g.238777  ORF g.238777 m.238777 type:complete len:67 (+) comp40171_c0_seq3:260-460(+)
MWYLLPGGGSEWTMPTGSIFQFPNLAASSGTQSLSWRGNWKTANRLKTPFRSPTVPTDSEVKSADA